MHAKYLLNENVTKARAESIRDDDRQMASSFRVPEKKPVEAIFGTKTARLEGTSIVGDVQRQLP